MTWLTALFVLAGVACPWLMCSSPLRVRVGAVVLLGIVGCCAWGCGVFGKRRRPMLLLFGSDLLAVSVAAGWIAVASYSAQISKVSTWLLYAVVVTGIMAPVLVSLRLIRARECGRNRESLLLILPLLLTASVFLARPARRFRAEDREAAGAIAESLGGVREAERWVHENIIYRAAPFTDTARDTIARGWAQCGGQANVLHKILVASGIRSRIVHLEGDSRIHTLVEYMDGTTGRWVLADPKHDIVGPDHGDVNAMGLIETNGTGLPPKWAGFSRAYIYDPMHGYVRVDAANRGGFYPEGGP